MSGYLRNIKKQYEFDGSTVEVVLKPILFKDTVLFETFVSDIEASVADPKERLRIQGVKLIEFFEKLLPRYIKSHDLKTADGDAVTTEELCTEAYFSQLLMLIGLDLVATGTIANPQKSDEP